VSGLRQPAGGAMARAAGLEGRVARLLRLGTYAAVILLAIGVALMLATGRSPLDAAPGLDPGSLVADVFSGQPAGFLWLGLLVVLATPAARVAVAVVGFARAGDTRMAIVAVLILLVIALGVVLGTIGGSTGG
jgi:uncharacterized membrane protein